VSSEPVSGTSAGPAGRRRRWEDDSPAELRLGERRAARHSDQHGTELRLEERWASVRRDDSGYPRAGHRAADHPGGDSRDPDHSGADYRDASLRGGDHDGSSYHGPDYRRPALPAASSEPSWNDSWDEPVRESRAHRYRPDFEISDERWR
jgi:hypothetical protein